MGNKSTLTIICNRMWKHLPSQLAAAVLGLLLSAAVCYGQSAPPTMPDKSVYGRLGTGTGSGPGQAIPFATFVAAAGLSGQLSNVVNAQTGTYAAVASDCTKTIALGGSAFYTFTVNASTLYSASCMMIVTNTDSTRGKLMAINGATFPNSTGILWPGQSFVLANISAVWTIIGLPIMWKPSAAVTFYVDTVSGSNTNNDCLGTGSGACQTLVNATNVFCQNVFPDNVQITFQLVSGQTHGTQGLCNYQSADLVEATNQPTIIGDTSSCANAANYTIDGGASSAVNPVGITTPWIVKGVKLASTTAGTSVGADNHSRLYLGTNVVFPAVTGFHITAIYDSFVELLNSYCITGGAAVHASASSNAKVLFRTGTITITNTPAFSSFFAQATSNGYINFQNATFSGSATGPRYSATTGGGLDTNGGGATFFPGNSGGSTNNPGWYN